MLAKHRRVFSLKNESEFCTREAGRSTVKLEQSRATQAGLVEHILKSCFELIGRRHSLFSTRKSVSSTPHIGAQAFIGIDDLGEVGPENGLCFALENAVERGGRQTSRSFEER